MEFLAGAEGGGEGDGEFAAEVGAEFLESVEDEEVAAAVFPGEFGIVGGEAAGAEGTDEAEGVGFGQKAEGGGVEGVEGDADGDGVAVGEAVFREQFEFVSGPMAVVEGAGGAEFEGVAGGGDVVEVEEGAALQDAADGGEVAAGDFGGGAFDGTEEGGVLDGGDFEGFGDAVEEEGEGEGIEEGGVVEDGPGGGEGTEEVFGAGEVDGVLDADAGVALGEGGGGDADKADAAVEEGGGESGGVEKGAAADGDAEGVAADVPGLQSRQHLPEGAVGLLDGFAAGENPWRADQMHDVGVGGEVSADFFRQIRESREGTLVQQNEATVGAGGSAADQGIAQDGIARREQIMGEDDGELVVDFDALEVEAHAGFQESLRVTVRLKTGAPGRESGSAQK